MLSSVVSLVGAPAVSANTSYSQTVTLPVAPASSFSGFSGGDGWDVSLDADRVYNVFHHQPDVKFACTNQVDASACGPLYPKTITDGGGLSFTTSRWSGTHLDPANGHLYTYGVRKPDLTVGVVCIDTTLPDITVNPFCGFTALSAVGAGVDSQVSVSGPSMIDGKWFAVNYAVSASGQDEILCFDVAAVAGCAGQPYDAGFTVGGGGYSTSAVDGRFMIQTGSSMGCFDATTLVECAGSWPVASGNGAAPFPHMDAAANVNGVCLPAGPSKCFDLSGTAIPTPAGLDAAITRGVWAHLSGPPVVIGTRVYSPKTNSPPDSIGCYDFAALAGCANFPKVLSGVQAVYTVNVDPFRPACIWVNSDNGVAQIQAFDAYDGGACGDGDIRVLASQFVVNEGGCFPSDYETLEILAPIPADYTSATVEFQTSSGGSTGIPNQNFDAAGVVDLSGLGLENQLALPQFLITVTDPPDPLGAVTLKLSWRGNYNQSCAGS